MDLLLHVCCAPCLIYPLEKLKEDGFRVSGLFYNPNIHPFSEYNNRRKAIAQLNHIKNIEILYGEYRPEEFFRKVNYKEENQNRCPVCWGLRLKHTAKIASQKGFKHFSTTLLVSPYQSQEIIKEIGEGIAKTYGLTFYYSDFRPGFRSAHAQAKQLGLYCQNYCGCIYSEIERFQKKADPHAKNKI
jgi:predicted adenine nucleotide alpha hydrolase (AANH) superfamily ATPase